MTSWRAFLCRLLRMRATHLFKKCQCGCEPLTKMSDFQDLTNSKTDSHTSHSEGKCVAISPAYFLGAKLGSKLFFISCYSKEIASSRPTAHSILLVATIAVMFEISYGLFAHNFASEVPTSTFLIIRLIGTISIP